MFPIHVCLQGLCWSCAVITKKTMTPLYESIKISKIWQCICWFFKWRTFWVHADYKVGYICLRPDCATIYLSGNASLAGAKRHVVNQRLTHILLIFFLCTLWHCEFPQLLGFVTTSLDEKTTAICSRMHTLHVIKCSSKTIHFSLVSGLADKLLQILPPDIRTEGYSSQ